VRIPLHEATYSFNTSMLDLHNKTDEGLAGINHSKSKLVAPIWCFTLDLL